MPIPECLKSGSAQEREWLNAWMEKMETKMALLEAGFTIQKKPIEGWSGGMNPNYHLDIRAGAGGGTATWQPISNLVTAVPSGYTPTPAQTSRMTALDVLMAKIEKEEKEKIATQKDKKDVENEDYLLDLTEEHIRDPAKKMAYGPLVTAALKQRIDAYHKEIRAVLSKKFRSPSPESSPVAVAGGGGGGESSDPRM
jgi:hypothetical protein